VARSGDAFVSTEGFLIYPEVMKLYLKMTNTTTNTKFGTQKARSLHNSKNGSILHTGQAQFSLIK
jgi:hypothetical protein